LDKGKSDPSLTPENFVRALVGSYRRNFDPVRLPAEIDQLQAEHSELIDLYTQLPTPLAKQKAKERFEKLEERIKELQTQQQDMSDIVADQYEEMLALQRSIAEAKIALRSESGERAFRQRAEAIRAVIQRIECTFVATGHKGGGPVKRNSKLVNVKIYPVAGDPASFNVLIASKEHSL